MGVEAGKIAVHCQAEIALETGAWERARWDLQAQLCKVEKEALFCRVGKATEESSGVQCDLLSSELIPTIWRRKKKIAIKFTLIFIAASTLMVATLTVSSVPDHQLHAVPSLHLGGDPSPNPQPTCCQQAPSQGAFSHCNRSSGQ